MQLAVDRMQIEERIAVFKAEKEFELAKYKAEMTGFAQAETEASMTAGYRPGGDLDK